MIPKVIHYCWFGGKDKPDALMRYIATWKRCLPDYEIREWNEQNFDYRRWRFCREAYRARKFAFVADVCRLYALSTIGGIYLDTDVEVVRSFDAFLDHESFVSIEDKGRINTGCIAAQKGTPWVEQFLRTYRKRTFIRWTGRELSWPNSYLLQQFLRKSDSKPQVYPLEYFCAKHYLTGELAVTEATVCIHHYEGTWLEAPLSLRIRLKQVLIKIQCLFC